MAAATSGLSTYRASGRVAPLYFGLIALAAVMLIAVAWIYQRLIQWVPFIYINLLIYIGFGAAIGVALVLAGQYGHNRNRVIGAVAGLAIAAAAVGASHYWAYRRAVSRVVSEVTKQSGMPESEVEKLVGKELTFSKFIDARVEQGWKLGRRTSGTGGSINGTFVWILWAIEALGLCAVGVFAGGVGDPYCERCRKWMDSKRLRESAPMPSSTIAQIAAASTIEGLWPGPSTEPPGPAWLRYTAHQCASCDGPAYLTIEQVTTRTTDKGPEEQVKTVRSRIEMPPANLVRHLEAAPPPAPDGLQPRP